MAIYVCSDIHGQYDLFKKILDKINFSDEDKMFVLGDAIDRGPEGIKLLQDLVDRKNVFFLLGNHELMMCDSLFTENYRRAEANWLDPRNGGNITKKQFFELEEDEQLKIVEFLRDAYLQCELILPNHTYLLSHSSFLPRQGTVQCGEVDHHLIHRVVWNSPWREWEYESKDTYQDGRIHIIGHVPVHGVIGEEEGFGSEKAFKEYIPKAYIDDNGAIINIDCGCALVTKNIVRYAGLCCMNLTAYDTGDVENAFVYEILDLKGRKKKR